MYRVQCIKWCVTGVQRGVRAAHPARYNGVSVCIRVRVRADVTGRPRRRGGGARTRPGAHARLTCHC